MENPRLTIKSPKMDIAKRIISNHFRVGSVGYDEAIDCAIITSEFMKDDELLNIIKKIKEWEVRNGNLYPDKPDDVVEDNINSRFKQMELF